MALTSAVAANAAAAAAGAGKKAAQVQLQAELNTDDDWNKFLQRDGLLVVDVYSEWCGPCTGMVGNLKKVKVELGGDNLHLAVAKSDTIECLKRFRNRSEPTWMFLAGGQLLDVVFGADAPRLARTIERELKTEALVRRGEAQRPSRAPNELTPLEQEVATAKENRERERKEKEVAANAAAREARREARARQLETYFPDVCPALLTPHGQKHLRKLVDALEPYGVVVSDKCPIVVGSEGARRLAAEDPELDSPPAVAVLTDRPCLALLLKKLPDREGDIIQLCRAALCGDGLEGEGEGPRKVFAEETRVEGVPGVFVPRDRHQRAQTLDLLYPKMVGAVVEPPVPPLAPHVAMVFGAWQRRAVLSTAADPSLAPRVLNHGFFADANVQQPRLLCKTLDQYEQRPEKDYSETLVLMVSVGVAEPALLPPGQAPPEGPPSQLLALVPLHVSIDSVAGAEECTQLFPPGYSEPDHKPKPKTKKKKKKRHETKEETTEESTAEPATSVETADEGGGEGEGEGDHEGEGEGEREGEAEEEEGDDTQADKATSPPPTTTH